MRLISNHEVACVAGAGDPSGVSMCPGGSDGGNQCVAPIAIFDPLCGFTTINNINVDAWTSSSSFDYTNCDGSAGQYSSGLDSNGTRFVEVTFNGSTVGMSVAPSWEQFSGILKITDADNIVYPNP